MILYYGFVNFILYGFCVLGDGFYFNWGVLCVVYFRIFDNSFILVYVMNKFYEIIYYYFFVVERKKNWLYKILF